MQVRSFVLYIRQSFFFLLSFAILYVKKKKKNSVFSYIRYIIYSSQCGTINVRVVVRSLSFSLSLNSNQRNVKENCWSLLFFPVRAERKEKTWYLCPKTYGKQRRKRPREVCVDGCGVDERMNEQIKKKVEDLDWCVYFFFSLTNLMLVTQ